MYVNDCYLRNFCCITYQQPVIALLIIIFTIPASDDVSDNKLPCRFKPLSLEYLVNAKFNGISEWFVGLGRAETRWVVRVLFYTQPFCYTDKMLGG